MQSDALRTAAVTGAFGYSGRAIAERLLAAGYSVRTLTGSPERAHSFGDRIEVFPLAFDEPAVLRAALAGADVLINTYWVRFEHRRFDAGHGGAVENTLRLFEAAREAGVGRVVHVSITNPDEASPLSYFRGKARLERALEESELRHSILRPAVLFGRGDILINNIAWALRRLPVFGVFGSGGYRLQPLHVDDFAALAVAECARGEAHRVVDAIGPETYTFRELVREVGSAIGERRPVVSVPPAFGHFVAWGLGALLGDVLLTRDEIDGLMADLLVTDSPPAGSTRLSCWAREHADSLGRRYANELARRRDRRRPYEEL